MHRSHPVNRRLRHGLRDWAVLSRTVREAEELLLLMDYDGTLTPIVATPEQAKLSTTMRTVLRQVARLPGVRLGIVSGRSLRSVRRLVRIPGLIYVGNHGCEIAGPGLSFTHPRAKRIERIMRRVASQLRAALRALHGSQVETKGMSMSVHWRRVRRRDLARFRRIVARILRPWVADRSVRVTRGKRVIEIRPPIAWDKGRAVEWIVRHGRPPKRMTVFYLGDDRTDEDAFRSANRLQGVSVFIGRRRTTTARWWLLNPSEVHELLQRILDTRPSTRGSSRAISRGTLGGRRLSGIARRRQRTAERPV